MTPILSIETIISAMMCLCSSNASRSNDFYSSLADKIKYNPQSPRQPVVLLQPSEIGSIQNRLNHLLERVEDMQQQLEKIKSALGTTNRAFERATPKIEVYLTPQSECPRRTTSNANGGQEDDVVLLGITASEEKQRVFQGLCTADGWLVVQQRFDGSVNFFRPWKDYRQGFGTLDGEFFMGLEQLHALTNDRHYSLLVELTDFEADKRYAEYSRFLIGNETENYALKILGKYEGTAGDSLRHHAGLDFTTRDRDHDAYEGNCANEYTGAWWFKDCLVSNLNGQYLKGPLSKEKLGKGMSWQTFRGLEYSLKRSRMMIRPQAED